MSDFGELCPLFNTGVYSEITFTNINGGTSLGFGTSLTGNMLEGCGGDTGGAVYLTKGAGPTMFTFGRTVVVTAAWLQRIATNKTAQNYILGHNTTQGAAATAFASCTFTNTISVVTTQSWVPFVVSASKTFTSSEILNLTIGTLTDDTVGTFNLIVQYREK